MSPLGAARCMESLIDNDITVQSATSRLRYPPTGQPFAETGMVNIRILLIIIEYY